MESRNNDKSVEHPCPGIVIIRNALTLEEKEILYEVIWANVNFFEEDGVTPNYITKLRYGGRDGFLIKNLIGCDKVNEILSRLRDWVESIDVELIFPPANYVLMQYYPTTRGMARHFDSFDGNNGDEGAPVYSFSLGNDCDFCYRNVEETKQDNERKVKLSSGDLIVFGGPQRNIFHRIKDVALGSCDEIGYRGARINLTFRTCTGFTDEDEFNYKTPQYLRKIRERSKNTVNI